MKRIEEKEIGPGVGGQTAKTRRLFLHTPLLSRGRERLLNTQAGTHLRLGTESSGCKAMLCVAFMGFFEQTARDNCTVSQSSGLE